MHFHNQKSLNGEHVEYKERYGSLWSSGRSTLLSSLLITINYAVMHFEHSEYIVLPALSQIIIIPRTNFAHELLTTQKARLRR